MKLRGDPSGGLEENSSFGSVAENFNQFMGVDAGEGESVVSLSVQGLWNAVPGQKMSVPIKISASAFGITLANFEMFFLDMNMEQTGQLWSSLAMQWKSGRPVSLLPAGLVDPQIWH